MKKKFIKGTFQLAENVTDLNAFNEKHGAAVDALISWADRYDVMMRFGTSDDDSYLCEYKIIRSTVKECKVRYTLLAKEIKARFPKAEELYQGCGDQLF